MIFDFAKDISGATAIEYGLIATFVALGILVGVSATGSQVANLWGKTATKVTEVAQPD